MGCEPRPFPRIELDARDPEGGIRRKAFPDALIPRGVDPELEQLLRWYYEQMAGRR